MKTLTSAFMVFLTSACMLSHAYATSCTNAIPISLNTGALPYVINPIICGLSDDINANNVTSPCPGADMAYLNGQESLYKLSITGTENLNNISFSYICQYSSGVGPDRYTGLFLYEGCPTAPDGVCIAYNTGNCGVTLAFDNNSSQIDLIAGHTYYLIIDTPVSSTNACPGNLTIQTYCPDIIVAPIIVDVCCPGACNGYIDLTVYGCSPPWSFLWSNGAITEDIYGLCEGDYYVMVTEWNADNPSGTMSTFGPFTVGIANIVPEFFTVTGAAISAVCYDATNTITARNFIVTGTGAAELLAGVKILIQPGMKVHTGGNFRAYISNTYCSASQGSPGNTSGISQPEIPYEPTFGQYTLCPNPTSGSFILKRKDDRFLDAVNVKICTMSGNLVLTWPATGEKQCLVPSSALPAGLYFVTVMADDHMETIKLVKTM